MISTLAAPHLNCTELEIIIAPRRIAFLKFILEGYDGLVMLSTLDAKQGKVILRFPECRRREVSELLDSLMASLA